VTEALLMKRLSNGTNYVRMGSGPPMVLFHGIGHRLQGWIPVLGELSKEFDVIAIDLPGFGLTPLSIGDVSLEGLIKWGLETLDELGVDRAHLVGNSLGGWIAFLLAQHDRALTVTTLAPAGLWTNSTRMFRKLRFLFDIWAGGAKRLHRVLGLLRFALVRTPALFPLFGRPWKIPGDIAVGDGENLAKSDFYSVFNAGEGLRFTGGQAIDVPVTVTWCGLDPLFSPRNSSIEELPSHTRVEQLPWCGHVPMWDNPAGVLRIIRSTVAGA
jgi:pimeloyl-ACP methyl ester carboxylesterase